MAEQNKKEDTLAQEKRPRKKRNFPNVGFQECYEFTKKIAEIGAGQKVRRLTIFENIGKSPDSGPSRMLVTNCSKYGLISGSYQAEYLQLTENGATATNSDLSEAAQLKAKFELVFSSIEIYKQLFEKFVNQKLPSHTVIADLLVEIQPDLEKSEIDAVVDTFIVNLKYLGLLKTLSGAERVITLDHAIENLPNNNDNNKIALRRGENESVELIEVKTENQVQVYETFDNICFYITPIGEENSEERKHSDLFLESIVEPALKTLGIQVKRADKIDKPGTITKQIIEYIFKSRLVIADLSYHNPNVFYELALRHSSRLPTIQLIRKSDRIPFDVNQTRTIVIDTTDIYSLVPKIEIYRSEIANQVRQALNGTGTESIDNPITNVFPKLQVKIF
ncbi:hypothetical protein [Dysgonomonas sp. HGC4]|uniref:hypothetical protein n=1 Tax=Dysgonomonas sp. HGC4 TaxID=1658009 RepID=UPI0006836B7A|nr:hypothetical protein [Dysgonomonas sp. HGC4]MBD8349756.1 hypothetical protein [Dysgonomonas sp. HGC4]